MISHFISEAIQPVADTFDTSGMARGEPGVPHRFVWRKREHTISAVLEQAKDYGDCKHGSGERYVRKHVYRVRTTDGLILKLYCQRTFGKAKPTRSRWWIQSIEGEIP